MPFATDQHFTVTKADTTLGVVYGYASVVEEMVGEHRVPITDLQGDIIPPAVLESAVVKFMEDYRTSGEMHQGAANGVIVESLFLSPEKGLAMGLPEAVAKGLPVGWWIGAKVTPDVMAKVKDGAYSMFSIQGDAEVA